MRRSEIPSDLTNLAGPNVVPTEPAREWITARDSGQLPGPVFRFYELANFFSIGRIPSFFSDPRRALFPYLGSLTWSLMESTVEIQALVAEVRTLHADLYS